MPPVRCHLNGGVNLASTRDVLEAVATTLRGRIRRITDGEVGDDQQAVNAAEPRRGARQQWIWFLITAYERADGLEEVEPAVLWGDDFPQLRVTGELQDIRFHGLGYAESRRKMAPLIGSDPSRWAQPAIVESTRRPTARRARSSSRSGKSAPGLESESMTRRVAPGRPYFGPGAAAQVRRLTASVGRWTAVCRAATP